jgi:short-subunit dehydrogenase
MGKALERQCGEVIRIGPLLQQRDDVLRAKQVFYTYVVGKRYKPDRASKVLKSYADQVSACLKDASVDVIKKVMEINFFGAVYCTKYALPYIIDKKGTIAGISSIAGYRGLPGRSGYSASKHALQGWLEAIRTELLETGVNVMWVSPGFTASNIRNAALNKEGELQGESPLDENKLMTSEECAERILNAIQKRKRTLVMTFDGKRAVFMNKFFPGLTDKLTRNFFYKDGKLVK